MIGYLIFAVALLGTSYAAYLDLKTTEVPDIVSMGVAGAGIILNGVLSYITGNIFYVAASIVVGAVLFALGWLAYLGGLWGGADAFVLGSIGFALPTLPPAFNPLYVAPWPFAVTLFLNLVVVGTLYILGYSIYKGLTSEGVMERFARDFKEYWRRIAAITLFFVAATAALTAYLSYSIGVNIRSALALWTAYIPMLIGLLLLYRYLKIVENDFMREKIDVKNLQEGDVLAEDVDVEGESIESQKIVGLEEKEIEKIQAARNQVAVRHGVRFVPSFPVTVVVSVLFGDIVFALMRSLA